MPHIASKQLVKRPHVADNHCKYNIMSHVLANYTVVANANTGLSAQPLG